MIPPLIRRCPECGHVNVNHRFPITTADNGHTLVECPSCHHEFEPIENPWLN